MYSSSQQMLSGFFVFNNSFIPFPFTGILFVMILGFIRVLIQFFYMLHCNSEKAKSVSQYSILLYYTAAYCLVLLQISKICLTVHSLPAISSTMLQINITCISVQVYIITYIYRLPAVYCTMLAALQKCYRSL